MVLLILVACLSFRMRLFYSKICFVIYVSVYEVSVKMYAGNLGGEKRGPDPLELEL